MLTVKSSVCLLDFKFQWIILYMNLCSWLLVLSLGISESISTLFTLPSRSIYLPHITKISLSLLFLRLNRPSCLWLSLYDRHSSSLTTFEAFWWSCSTKSVSLLSWGGQDWTQHYRCASPVLNKGEGSPPTICWQQSAFCHLGGCWHSLLQGHIVSLW